MCIEARHFWRHARDKFAKGAASAPEEPTKRREKNAFYQHCKLSAIHRSGIETGMPGARATGIGMPKRRHLGFCGTKPESDHRTHYLSSDRPEARGVAQK
jgi:hypothetical protein